VRIYGTSAGTAAIERCEKSDKGSKITNKFLKHATTYGFPEFPLGYSFWTFMQLCAQYNVELRQNCTKVVDLTTVDKMDNLRTYQKMFLMTRKEIEFLYEQFKRLDSSNTCSLSPKDLKKDLTVFGFNYPPENRYFLDQEEKNDKRRFLNLWNKEVKKILAIDSDTHKCSFDEFLLLFVRQQANLEWNELLPRYYKEKKKLPFKRCI